MKRKKTPLGTASKKNFTAESYHKGEKNTHE